MPTFSLYDEIRSNETIDWINSNKCNSFEIEWECVEKENNMPKNQWWKIVSYAPYNWFDINDTDIQKWFNKSYKIFWSWNIVYDNHQNIYWINKWSPSFNINNWSFTTPTDWCKENCNLLENWYFFNDNNNIIKDTKNDVTWVYISNISNKNYLKYENLNLNWNFAIEIKVKVPNIDNWNKSFLLHWWYNLMLYIQNKKLYFKNTSNNGIPYYISTLIPWYNKIILIKENSLLKVKIWDNETIEIPSYSINFTINELIVWAFQNLTDYQYQINNIIDYFKIYKK
jgi:hypothetical protein